MTLSLCCTTSHRRPRCAGGGLDPRDQFGVSQARTTEVPTTTTTTPTPDCGPGGPGYFDLVGCTPTTTTRPTRPTTTTTTTKPRMVELLAEVDYLDEILSHHPGATFGGVRPSNSRWNDEAISWGRGTCKRLDEMRLQSFTFSALGLDSSDRDHARFTAQIVQLAIIHLCPHHQGLLR